jgi:hypothetical protein
MPTTTLPKGSHRFQNFIITLPGRFVVHIKISKPESEVPLKLENQPTLV